MENKDYCAPEEEQSTSNSYENPYQQSNPYESYTYGNNTYGQNRYSNLGGVMVDEKGVPLKNHFAVKLVFSIIMILMCCFSPLVSILGIIGLVFACLANSAYNEGNPYDFKSKSRVSTVLLAIGGGIMALMIVFYIIIFAIIGASAGGLEGLLDEYYNELYGEDYPGDYWNDDYWDDILGSESEDAGYGSDYVEEYPGTNTSPLADGFHQFTYNGVTYEVPMSYNTFLSMGYTLEGFDEKAVFDAGWYETYEFVIDEDYAGVVRVSNNSNESLIITECEIDLFCIYNTKAYERVESAGIEDLNLYILGNVAIGSGYEKFEQVLGTPYYVYTEKDETYGNFVTYQWLYEGIDEIQRVEISFYNGKVCDYSVDHYEY